jgi:hypothetical protein
MAPSKRVHTSTNEGSILLALSAIRSGAIGSANAAAKVYRVSKTTLLRRLQGTPSREEYIPQNMKLTPIEEEVLLQDILRLDSQGLSPTTGLVQSMANAICQAKGGPPVGRNWTSTFIKRTPALTIKLGRTYECQRRLCETQEVIKGWFALVRNTIDKHGILPQDIYNFDETGFQLGQISTSKVVTSIEKSGRPKQIKPTGIEWVTVIQGACADGSAIPPFIIFKGKEVNNRWLCEGLPSTWMFIASPKGWTSDQIGLQWVSHFDKHTKSKTIGSKRLLILDNHGSHTTPEFTSFCENNNIVLLWMPSHTSHMLQPLDVGCFGPLKQAYSKKTQSLIRNHIFHIDKSTFIATLYAAYIDAITSHNIQAGFKGSGLHPFDPEVVLSSLDPILLSPPRPLLQGSWCAKTPKTTQEVDQQATLIKQRLERHQSSSPTPIFEALNQLSKGAQMIATSAALLQSRVTDLEAANTAMHIRKSRKRKSLLSENALSVQAIQQLIEKEEIEEQILEEMPRPAKRTTRCSKCRSTAYTARTCVV